MTKPPNGRPAKAVDLLWQGDTSSKWDQRNFERWEPRNLNKDRFLVLNLQDLMTELHIGWSTCSPAMRAAEKIINDKTQWRTQLKRFEWKCSRVQLQEPRECKWFDKAAVIIVAMEWLVSEAGSDINVYDRLAIMPADHFLDAFNSQRLTELRDYIVALEPDKRVELFGAGATNFDSLALTAVKQELSQNLLFEMTQGFTVPAHVAWLLANFINDEARFPKDLHVGSVRTAGDGNAKDRTLGVDGAAPSLRFDEPFDLQQDALAPKKS